MNKNTIAGSLIIAALVLGAGFVQQSAAQDKRGGDESATAAARLDNALGKNAALPQYEGSALRRNGVDLPRFLPAWIFGQPVNRQSVLAGNLLNPATVARVRGAYR